MKISKRVKDLPLILRHRVILILLSVYATPSHPAAFGNTLGTSTHSETSTSSLGHILGNMRAGSRRHVERSTNQGDNYMCGIRPQQKNYDPINDVVFESRVVGGVPSDHRWPWQVLLYDTTGKQPFCGGVLIGSQHVLTAAHCFKNHDRKDIIIMVGEHDLLVEEGSERNYTIECLFMHKKYVDRVPYNHDIAMIKLKGKAVQFTKDVMPACLPTKGEFKRNTMCYITGWGFTNFEDLFLGKLPSVVHEATVPLIKLKVCQQVYGIQITSRMQCAGYLEGTERADSCKGDSGGPLVCQDEQSGRFKLWGLTSWGDNHFCALEPIQPAPGVYTRIDKYLRWIEHKMTTSKCK